ncbi:hypothetical protein F5X68DRAFT_274472 [Plectosphaerella plurivora]|uniref:Thioredoxin-like fold domain-containing protein n=1 Tax=Plectosphaerella plurivora TaxID=936078 RepID=A0A9P8VG72_9PEZI|nr:hypothetical protein F5X68DRAFT_274472 [Plectosphaerella plurivora]
MSEHRRLPPAPTHWLAVPSPIAALFKRVPLAVYAANDLPLRSPSSERDRTLPILYVFTTEDGARRGKPSFNPSCLKWQTILKIARVPFTTRPSNNHSSPTGALPFLLPAPSSTPSNNFPIPSGNALLNHALSNAAPPNILDDAVSSRQEAYISLITLKIRPALLHALYVNKANTPLLKALYIDPSSRNMIVRSTLLHQVRGAAESEILSTTRRGFIDTDVLYADAKAAFSALETILLETSGSGSADGFFSGAAEAAILDAEVFAYTNLILDETLGWVDNHLRNYLSEYPALTRHRENMLRTYFSETS